MMKKKRIFACAITVLLLAITSWADDKEKDEDRLKNAGTVLREILNIPDDIPQDLLDKPTVWLFFHQSSRPRLWSVVVMAAVR